MNLYVGQSGDKKLIEAALAAMESFPPAEFFQFESSPTSLGEYALKAQVSESMEAKYLNEQFSLIRAFFEGFQKAWWAAKA